MNIWYDILFVVNSVSKILQSKDMHIDIAIDQLKGLVVYLENYRQNGFMSALNSTKELANEMNIQPIFREKRKIHRKKQFDESIGNETIFNAEESFRIEYFLYIVDKSLGSIESRFEQFKTYKKILVFCLI